MSGAEIVKLVLGLPVIVIASLSIIAQKRPDVRWLQTFNLQDRLTGEQRARMRKTHNRIAGVQLILLGIVIPIGYVAVSVMFFSAMPKGEVVIIGLVSALCVVLGLVALLRPE